jgi:hypothetical protein
LPNKVLHNSVIIGTLNANGEALIVRDVPIVDAFGRESKKGNMLDQAGNDIGDIDYLTGVLDVTFGVAPADGENITYEFEAFSDSQPEGILFFDNTLTLRPVPDEVYEVQFQARVTPDPLVNDVDTPPVKAWWQYIALGAAKKIFEDLSNYEAIQNITGEFQHQESLIMTKSDLARSKQAPATMFNTVVLSNPYGWYYNG